VTVWRVLKLGAGTVAVILLAVAVPVLQPLLWPPDPDASLVLENGKLTGETVGYLWQVDTDARTVRVSSSLLGLRAVSLEVTDETKILIHDKQGGFRDLWKDMLVRASYEVRGAAHVAKSIELVDSAVGSRAPVTDVGTAPQPERAPSRVPITVTAPPSVPVPEPARPEAPAPRAAASPVTKPVADLRPGSPAAERPVPRVPSAPEVAREPLSSPAVVAPPRGASGEGDTLDGSAAIDWLLKESRRP
jgi:hypothetical protein